ncbi:MULTISPECIES: hypothetical protein [unclassified Coleofasciculus]|uniref:hypothetical protein n=1 Tax=Cyanophyceae TaxID=3028117 RepID=UPI0016829259|nr:MULTISPECIES: hypothetical protein [unclassified Coleofasciculus]MBD1839679.1 hypothetical protein [Coleofasciculus sp. FACHB-501]MBD1881365.1 hypothetical protein [Coleofasciculus sp. FACHB-T130]MBD1891185.1 hypothetical protein [Coleofasciculus sp. FACHB-SPT9]MBD1896115.1 hypothetical protein [Coleofasciculus sp. FACHB-129]MBD1944227.1 hypothetical protein [Coleofasciculus sp. FACHB-712]
MRYQFLRVKNLFLSVVLAVAGTVVIRASENVPVQARPAPVFTRHLETIQSSVPPGLIMRLPSQILLSGPTDVDPSELIVRVFPSETPLAYTVSLFTCYSNPQPCLVGSFSVEKKNSLNAIRELEKHKAAGDRITLRKDIRGYLLEGKKQKPSYEFSSVMWQQDDFIYRVSFPTIERSNILLMANSMANDVPLFRRVSRPLP